MVSMVALNPALDQRVDESPLAALVSRICQGDEQALAALYDGTCGMVYGLALRVVGSPACAEDIALEVYLQVWRTAQTYNVSRGSVSAWLVTIARSRAIDWLRSRKARAAEVTDPIDEIHELRDQRPSPEVVSMEANRSRAVREAMASLPEEQRRLIELAYFSGLSHNEIARDLGLPLGTVKSRIRLGMLHMRESLGSYAEELR
jgi:RNA polymerase sigma-70 factor, ECF subfamily